MIYLKFYPQSIGYSISPLLVTGLFTVSHTSTDTKLWVYIYVYLSISQHTRTYKIFQNYTLCLLLKMLTSIINFLYLPLFIILLPIFDESSKLLTEFPSIHRFSLASICAPPEHSLCLRLSRVSFFFY